MRSILEVKIWGFNTQPPEGGCRYAICQRDAEVGFNTQPPEGGCLNDIVTVHLLIWFQHTAARRRLLLGQTLTSGADGFNTQPPEGGCQHLFCCALLSAGFNTQPPEGGCLCHISGGLDFGLFQHTAARRRLPDASSSTQSKRWFQHTAARRRLRPHLLFYNCCTSVSTHSRPKAAAYG